MPGLTRHPAFFAQKAGCWIKSGVTIKATSPFVILPWQGRWLAAGQTEGCHALNRETPLHHIRSSLCRMHCAAFHDVEKDYYKPAALRVSNARSPNNTSSTTLKLKQVFPCRRFANAGDTPSDNAASV